MSERVALALEGDADQKKGAEDTQAGEGISEDAFAGPARACCPVHARGVRHRVVLPAPPRDLTAGIDHEGFNTRKLGIIRSLSRATDY